MKSLMQHVVFFAAAILVVTIVRADESPLSSNPDRNRDELLKRLSDDNLDTIVETLGDLKFASNERKRSIKRRLIELIDSSRDDLRKSAIELLSDIGFDAAEAMPALQDQLADVSPEIRFAAAEAVWRVGGRADLAASVFIAELKGVANADDEKTERWLRESASSHLQRMGPAAAVSLESLLMLSEDSRELVRREVAEILGALGPRYREQVEKRLVAALDDPSADVRLAAAIGMSQIDAKLDRAVEVLVELASMEIPHSDETSINPWGQSDPPTSAVQALGELQSDASPAVTALIKLLKSQVLAIRLEAATALGLIGPEAKEAIPALFEALHEIETHSMPFAHRIWCVGNNAAEALEKIGVDAAPVLIKALNDDKFVVRARASKALGCIPSAASFSVRPLSKRLDDSEPFVRIEAAKALGKLGPLAAEAAPQLAKLLVKGKSVTTFRAGSGIGMTESTGEEALQALSSIKPKADQVVPALVEAINETEDISYEAICVLRQFPVEAAAAREVIVRLLKREDKRFPAACALAFVAPDHDEIQPILEKAVFEGENPGWFATLGLSHLAATGRKFDDSFRSRLFALAEKRHNLLLWQCVFRLMPNDERATESFVSAIQNAHSTFDAVALREVEKTVLEIITGNKQLKAAFLRELEYVAEYIEGGEEYYRSRDQSRRRIQAARILITARVEVERALLCLSQLLQEGDMTAACQSADFLSEDASPPQEAIPLLSTLIDVNETYVIGGDFYGNGGELRVAGDRAAIALLNLKAKDALIGKLDSVNADARVSVVRALGHFDGESVISALLPRTNDLDYSVRKEAVVALGRIGKANPEVRVRLRGILQASEKDRRHSVRVAASRAIVEWDTNP